MYNVLNVIKKQIKQQNVVLQVPYNSWRVLPIEIITTRLLKLFREISHWFLYLYSKNVLFSMFRWDYQRPK